MEASPLAGEANGIRLGGGHRLDVCHFIELGHEKERSFDRIFANCELEVI